MNINDLNKLFSIVKYMKVKFFGILCLVSCGVQAQVVLTDNNTPLHLLKPDYPHAYGQTDVYKVKANLDKVLDYLSQVTPAMLIDKRTGDQLDPAKLDKNAVFAPGHYRLISYEWGVTYSAMLLASEVTKDERYKNYTLERLQLISNLATYYNEVPDRQLLNDSPISNVLNPQALDDAGALCMAMIKTTMLTDGNEDLRPIIDNFIDFIMNKEYRLIDGTFARNRPLKNTVWLDDLFMSVPALAYMGKLTGDEKYFDEAAKQVIQFSNRMFDRKRSLFIHGWIEHSKLQPRFHWARANGWAILALTELLDLMPEKHRDRAMIMNYYLDHVSGLAAVQSGNGLWHQLLDRNDSYLETSSTAIFAYSIAKGINKGWIDYAAFGPMVLLAWEALAAQINEEGKVLGTCVGTGMGFDPAFYYYRPVNAHAAHSYGPMLLAGAEIITLLKTYNYEINETAMQFLQD